jgi:hypothetical protein
MGTSLNGLTPSATYSGLIKFGDNSAIGASLKYISDGDGNDTLLALSTTSLNIGANNLSARVGIKGSGSTSATTSLLVQNSAGTQMLKLSDDGQLNLRATMVFDINTGIFDGSAWYQAVNNSNCSVYGDGGASSGVRVTGSTYSSGASQIQIKGATSISSGFNQPDASAQLDVVSTTKGFLPPRMTNSQRTSISSPAVGLMVYCTDAVEGLYINKSTGWTLVI